MAENRDDQRPPSWFPAPRLPRYGGEAGEPIDTFTEEADRVLKAYKMPENIACEFLLRHLEGSARREVLGLPEGGRDTVQKITTHLKKIFGDRRPRVLHIEQFNQRKQQPGETLTSYYLSLQELAAKVKAAGGEVSDNDLRDRFVERLLDGGLRRDLRRARELKPEITLLELREQALQWAQEEEGEAGQLITNSQATSNTTEDTLSKVLTALKGVEDRLCQVELCAKQRQQPSQRPQPQQQQQPSRLCYRCNQPGHMNRNCPQGNDRPLRR
jgi:hypothetical protein